jgi:hypothetical protein
VSLSPSPPNFYALNFSKNKYVGKNINAYSTEINGKCKTPKGYKSINTSRFRAVTNTTKLVIVLLIFSSINSTHPFLHSFTH